tara:strand:+ start:18416 stop:19789 length:1374 start_codon:yes stop_codon:yes gene_type:complete
MSEEEVQTEEAQPAPQEAPQDNPLFKTLFEIGENVETSATEEPEEPKEVPMTLNEAMEVLDEPAPEEAKEESTEEVAEEATEAVAPEKTEPKKKKLRKVVDPDIPDAVKNQPAFNFQEEEEVDDFAETLMPEEREVYDIAKYASKNMGEKYKGYDVKFKDYFTKSKAYLDKKMEDDPHFNPATDEEYSSFIERNRPKLSATEAKKIERKMWVEEAKDEVRKELVPRTEALRRELERAKMQPVMGQAQAKFRNMAQKVVIPKEFREKFEKGGDKAIAEFAKESPLEYSILENGTRKLLSYGDTLTGIFLNTIDLDMNNPVHKELLDWVNLEQEGYISSGQTEQDGKVFMRRERYYALPEDQRSQYYTWTDDDILKILALRVQEEVANSLEKQRLVLEKSGYVRQDATTEAPAQAPKQVAPAQPAPPPAVNTTPRQGGAVSQPKAKEQPNAMLNVLGID